MAEIPLPNIPVYHANTCEKCNDFIDKKSLIIHNDREYLGRGMYFWDNLGNAEWWKRKKKKKTTSKICILSGRLFLQDPILDLTNRDEIRLIRDLWYKYCDKNDIEHDKQPLGFILDILFQAFPELNEIKVIKANGDYSTHQKTNFLLKEGRRIDDRTKALYCVKSQERLDYFEVLTD